MLEIHQDEYQRQWSSYPRRHVHGMDHMSLCIHRSILNHSVTTFHPKQRKHDMVNTSNVWLLSGLSEFIMICSMKIFTISYSSIPTSPVAFPIVSIIICHPFPSTSLSKIFTKTNVIHFLQHHFQRSSPKPCVFLLFDLYLFLIPPCHYAKGSCHGISASGSEFVDNVEFMEGAPPAPETREVKSSNISELVAQNYWWNC